MKKLLTSIALTALLSTVGCKNASPLSLSLATSTIVSYGLRNSPNTANYLRSVQPIACAVATDTDTLNPAQILAAIDADALGSSPEGRAILTGVLLLYISAYDSQESNTNAAAVRPYAKAVFCDGLALGLAGAPMTKSRNAPPKVIWPMPKR